MKKLLLAVSLCLLLVPTLTFASIDNNLSYGLQQNSDVRQLQEFLIDKGFLTGSATGNFFSLTLKAVKAYQTSVGINSTGYVGNLTRTSINNELATNLSSSNQDAVNETGTTPPTQNPPATTTDVVASLKAQIALLMQQVQAMQQQNTTVQQLQQTVQQQSQTIQQIQQNTQQIAQNTCTPNWQCGDWTTCANSQQTRTCTDSNNCGNTNGKPVLTQSCNMPVLPCADSQVTMKLDPSTPPSATISANNDNLFLTLDITADNGNGNGTAKGAIIHTIPIELASYCFSSLELYDGNTLVATADTNSRGFCIGEVWGPTEFGNLSINVPAGTTKVLSIKGTVIPSSDHGPIVMGVSTFENQEPSASGFCVQGATTPVILTNATSFDSNAGLWGNPMTIAN